MKRLLFSLVLLLSCGIAHSADVKYYDVPRGAHPHDVAPDPEPGGPVWYTAQHQGALGRLDPGTGKVEQIPLGEGSRPHGVIIGPDGAPWVTDGGLNAIVRVDPVPVKSPLPAADHENATSTRPRSTRPVACGSPARPVTTGAWTLRAAR